MHKYQRVILLILLVISPIFSIALAQTQTIKVMGVRAEVDPANYYFTALTKLVLSKTSHLYPNDSMEVINSKGIPQGRLFRFLDNESLDIIWSGTNEMREMQYIPIRIPLTKGMLGYRVLLVHKDNQDKFNQITNESKLKKLIACQGAHWPDSDILEDNGYTVSRVVHYEAMFQMLNKKRCDYFPRAVFEGKIELVNMHDQYPNLVLVEKMLIKYHLPLYFFVSKTDTVLAKRLHEGLIEATKDGSLIDLLKSHETTKHIFPLSQWQGSRVFSLINAKLPKKTPLDNQALWINL